MSYPIPDSALGALFIFVGILGWFLKARLQRWLDEQAQNKQLAVEASQRRELEAQSWVDAYRAQQEAQVKALQEDKAALQVEINRLRAAQAADVEHWRSLAQDALLALKQNSNSNSKIINLAKRAKSLQGHSLPGLSLEEISEGDND